MTKRITFEATREGYTKDQVDYPITVGELIEFLEDYDEDTEILLSHDSGYTFGTLTLNVAEEWD